ncbi:NB-ARC domain-containing protein [Roseofilum casamattae]|uniref:NB-ARC domain-containing protein n=1 Tax=Roseofilum casamattae BLCC-M143 TaxID=3022442 RepID=A0ABT7BX87_9CYAN|nr:NB-ARC domain-containing protein [Roseofilum casamattae]MDJ1182903.1 NB-ARC domain-containing protein [Roseofilum casamattae BLCC-M143]
MDAQHLMEWLDKLMVEKTGSHLNNLEQVVLRGVWNNQKYKKIADEYHCTEANVKRVASELYSFLSEELEEKVSKSNFRAAMERYYISNSSVGNFAQSQFFGSEIHLCRENFNSGRPEKPDLNPTINQLEKIHDRTHIPKYDRLYQRTDELNTLKHWILDKKSAIIAIYGLSGIGKTALATQLVDEIEDNFDRLIWYSHRTFPHLNALTTQLIQFLSQGATTKNCTLLDYLRSHRCLIILDDFQETLTPRKPVGHYQPEYQTYGKLLQEIGQSPHNSCLLLLSWEQPVEIATLAANHNSCQTLHLQGLGETAKQLLQAKQLTHEEQWLELINLYSGNPSWLNIITFTIAELFNGSVAQFLSYSPLFLGDIKSLLDTHYQRLSSSERSLLHWLADREIDFDLKIQPTDIPENINILDTLQSLLKRDLVMKLTHKNQSIIRLSPVIKHYLQQHKN